MSANDYRKEVEEIEYSTVPKFHGFSMPIQHIDDRGNRVFSFTSGFKIVTSSAMKSIIEEYTGFPFYIDACNGYPEVKVIDAYLCLDEKHLH